MKNITVTSLLIFIQCSKVIHLTNARNVCPIHTDQGKYLLSYVTCFFRTLPRTNHSLTRLTFHSPDLFFRLTQLWISLICTVTQSYAEIKLEKDTSP
jgi:hypothetical protein